MIDLKEPNAKAVDDSSESSDRLTVCRRRLIRLGADGNDPRWSSQILDDLVSSVTATDLLQALFDLLGENNVALSQPLANLIKDLVIATFTRKRAEYQQVDWRQIARSITSEPTQAQLYFALHALPPEMLSANVAGAIVVGLQKTAFGEEARRSLSD